MQVNLTLTDDGPAFLMLGDPTQLSLLLSFENPGPQRVDFTLLSAADQRRVLAHINAEQLESDVPYEALVAEYQRLFSQAAPAEPPKVATQPAPQAVGASGPTMQLPQKHVDLQVEFEKRCKALSRKSLKALKKEFADDVDIRVLRRLRDLELEKRSPRKSILDFIELAIRQYNEAVINSIEKNDDADTIEKKMDLQGETFVSDVIESEHETVQLTPEMIIDDEN